MKIKIKKRKILPIISFILLLGSIFLAVYFKNLEKDLSRQQKQVQIEK